MKKAMDKWLAKYGIDVGTDATRLVCTNLGLDEEKVDSCVMLCYQFEKGDIDRAEYTGGLSMLSGKKPEEVMKILKEIKNDTKEV